MSQHPHLDSRSLPKTKKSNMKPHFKLHLDGRLSLVEPSFRTLFAHPVSRAPEQQDSQSASDTGMGTFPKCDMLGPDIVAALHKKGTSLRKIAQQNDYSHIQRVLTSPWLAAEQLVAKALGMKPEDIWPSRYQNPAARALAYRQTRKIAITMPRKRRQTASEARV